MQKIKFMILKEAKAIRNIYNMNEVNDYILSVIEDKNIHDIQIILWIKRNLKNYLIREYESVRFIENLSEVTEDWAITGIKNKTLQRIVLHKEFQDKILHVIDFLQAEYLYKRLDTLSVPDAIEQSIKWTEQQEEQDDDPYGIQSIMNFEDGYSIIEMTSKQALLYEGYKMKHCIGLIHANQILKQNKRAFSLRDKNNKPHVTIMYDSLTHTFEEIKGPSNHFVKPLYQPYIVQFFNQTLLRYSKINDYNYLSQIFFNRQEQRFEINLSRDYNYSVFEFKKHVFHDFSMAQKERFHSKEILEPIEITKLGKSTFHLKDMTFQSLKLSAENITTDTLKYLKVREMTLLLDKTSDDIVLDSEFVHIGLKKQSRIGHFKTIDLSHAKEVTMTTETGKEIFIDTLILGENLSLLCLSHIRIKNLIIHPNSHAKMSFNQTQIKHSKLIANHLSLTDCHLNDISVQANIVESYSTILPVQSLIQDFFLSNTSHPKMCSNQLTPGVKSFTHPEKLDGFISNENKPFDLIQAEFFDSPLHFQTIDFDNQQLWNKVQPICQPEYLSQVQEIF